MNELSLVKGPGKTMSVIKNKETSRENSVCKDCANLIKRVDNVWVCNARRDQLLEMYQVIDCSDYVERRMGKKKETPAKPKTDKYKADAGKARLSLVPQKILFAIARVREYGNNKYPEGGKDNWKLVDNAKERYTDALLRHTSAFVENPLGRDEESGLPHLFQMACNVAFLVNLYWEELKDKND